MATTTPVEYPTIANSRIDSVVRQAEKKEINLTVNYEKRNKSYKLQSKLDHIGRDLHWNFSETTTTNGRKYQDYIDCLDRIIEICRPQNHLSEKMRKRKKYIKGFFIDSLRIEDKVLRFAG